MAAKIITVASTKGGVGKTTISLNIAIGLALRGKDTWLVDADLQATASLALTVRGESGRQPTIATAHYPDGGALVAQVKHQRAKFEYIVIDSGGRDSLALRRAIGLADILLVPFSPRSIDLWSLGDVSSLIDDARAARDGLDAYALLSMADPVGSDNEEAAAAVADFPALKYLDAPIRRRKSIAVAAGLGQSVFEFTPKDAKAVEEMTVLLDAVI